MQNAIAQATLSRPADTTPYAAGEVVGALLTFSALNAIDPGSGAGGLIESALLVSGAYVATAPDLQLWLFSAPIADLDADNALFSPTDAQLATLLGIVDFAGSSFRTGDATAGVNGNQVAIVNSLGLVITGPNIYGVLIVRNAYVPVASETFTVVLGIIR